MCDAIRPQGGGCLGCVLVIVAMSAAASGEAAEQARPVEQVPARAAATMRVWTSQNGTYTVRATLLETQGETVRLKTADGRSIDVRLDALSDADRQYVGELAHQDASAGDAKNKDGPAPVEDDSEAPKLPGRKALLNVEKALAKKSELDFKEVPLAEALSRVGTQYGVDIVPLWRQIDEDQSGSGRRTRGAKAHKVPAGKPGPQAQATAHAGEERGSSARAMPVTMRISGEKLSKTLAILLRDLGLFYFVCDNSIIVTSAEHYETNLVTRVYPLPALKPVARPLPLPKGVPGLPVVRNVTSFDFDSVIDGITSIVSPTSWETAGGSGSVAPMEVNKSPVLVIYQLPVVHDEIASFLKTTAVPESRSVFGPRGTSKVAVALRQPCPVDFKEAKLAEALAAIEGREKVHLRVDRKSLEDMGVDAENSAVKFSASGLTVHGVLTYMLNEIGAAWTVDGETIIVCSAEDAESRLQAIRYPVSDLLARLGNDTETLVDVLTSTVEPTTWDSAGGPGSIAPEPQGPSGPALAVSQTYRVHEQIAELLAALRTVAGTGGRRR